MTIEYCRFANADSFIRLENGRLHVRISDLLEGAPAPVTEALAYILLGKLYRKPVARVYARRYRLYLNRRDMRRQAHLVRQIRGRKFVSGPRGQVHNLEEIFERLNADFSMACWAGRNWDGAAGPRGACWATSILRTTPSSSAASSTARKRRGWRWST